MAVLPSEFKFFRTTGNATGSDQNDPQNDKNDSLGGWCSTTESTSGVNNLFPEWTIAEKAASTKYRCLCFLHTNVTDVLDAARLLAEDVDTYPAEVTIKFGIQTNDSTTVAPVCADENTAPAGITFVSLTEKTGVPATDLPLAEKIGPRNLPSTGLVDIDMDDDDRIFLFVEFTCLALTDTLDSLTFTAPILGDAV